jgi:ATP-dependent RNA helicase RhlE
MLDMGFLPQIRRIFVRMPHERQNLLFSATMPPEVEDLVHDFLPDARRVQVGARSQAAHTVSHSVLRCGDRDKIIELERILEREHGRVLIFTRTKLRCEQLGNQLRRARFPADAIHGDKSAEARHAVLQSFERGKTLFLVATDVAARGIDVSDIDLVINYDVPLQVEDYVHRIGRTGRAGQSGRALTLVGPREGGLWSAIERHLGRGESGRRPVAVTNEHGRSHASSRSKHADHKPAVHRGHSHQGQGSRGERVRERSGARPALAQPAARA